MLTKGDNDSNLTTKPVAPDGGDKVRRALPRTFESFTEHWRFHFFELLVAKYTLQGHEDPKAKALAKIAEKPLQTKRAWQRQVYFAMQAIDKERVKMGLRKIHFL